MKFDIIPNVTIGVSSINLRRKMKNLKRKICSALCCLSVLSGANKVESFSFKDACRLARKVPDFVLYVDRAVSRAVNYLWLYVDEFVFRHIVFGEPMVVVGGICTFDFILEPGARVPTNFIFAAMGWISFLNTCNGFYPEDEESSKSDDRSGKEQKETKKDRIENSLKDKEKSTSKDESSS